MKKIDSIYTIGHSTHSIKYFLELLASHSINCIVDVRSVAASSYSPQFNKNTLSSYLKTSGINYLHFAKEFGARHTNPFLLDDHGKVDFEKVRKSQEFLSGISRIKQGITKGYIIALMCSEADPFDCHRFSMLSIAMEKVGFNVKHILKDRTLISNKELEEKLLEKYEKKLPRPSIFESYISKEDQLKFAYRLKNREIAYSPKIGNPIEEKV